MLRIKAMLFVLVWASCAWFGSWELNPNNATRLFAALSIVEDGDATIDEWGDLTIDKAQFDGHLYLDKAPGMTLMALPAVAAITALSPQRAHDFPVKSFVDPALARFLKVRTRVAATTGPAVLTAVAAVLLFDLALAVSGSAGGALVASLGYALGTPAWGWSTTITGHAAVAALFVVALWAGWRRSAVVLGASLGWAVVVEYQAVLAGGAIALWAAWRAGWRWRFLAAASAAGLAAMVPMVAYNLFAFGTPIKLGYAGVVGFEGMNRGFFGLGVPDPQVLWEIVFGTRRGLLWVAPILLVAPLGLATLVEERRTRGLGWAAIGVTTIALLVNAAYYYWDGGNSTGPRHALPLVGVAALGIAAFWPTLPRGGRVFVAGLLAGAIGINAIIASAEIFAPPQYGVALTEAVMPLFRSGNLRTVSNEWWGWSPWSGFAFWAIPAAAAIASLIVHVRREA